LVALETLELAEFIDFEMDVDWLTFAIVWLYARK